MIDINMTLEDGTRVCGWAADTPLTPFAPTDNYYITYKQVFSEEECKEWNDYLLEQEPLLLAEHITSSGDGLTGVGPNTITSRYGHFNVLSFDFHLVAKLKAEIIKGVKTILELSNNRSWTDTLYANSWFNVLRRGEGMDVHAHGYHKHSFYGFHLSINAKETATSYFHPIKFEMSAFHIPNKIGELTLFPAYVSHGVSENRHEAHRVSIAGDIKTSSWLDDPTYGQEGLQKLAVEVGTV